MDKYKAKAAAHCLFFFITFMIFHANKTLAQNHTWKFKHEKDGIKIFYRIDSTGSKVYELRLLTSVYGTLSSVISLLADVEAYPTWIYKTSESYLIKRISDTEMYYYVAVDFPWPMDDRDMTVHSKTEQNKKTKVVQSYSSAVKGIKATQKGRVRMEVIDTRWILTPRADGRIDIEYTLRSNPGGKLPPFIVNLALDYGPVETMKRFKKALTFDKYRFAKLHYILEKNSYEE